MPLRFGAFLFQLLKRRNQAGNRLVPAAGGFLLGIVFLLLLDIILPHIHPGASKPEGVHSSFKRTTLLILAVTLHNIPEGMAVGLSFALAGQHGGDPAAFSAACALALGMGIQNFPEGAAVSLPLRAGRTFGGKVFPIQAAYPVL